MTSSNPFAPSLYPPGCSRPPEDPMPDPPFPERIVG